MKSRKVVTLALLVSEIHLKLKSHQDIKPNIPFVTSLKDPQIQQIDLSQFNAWFSSRGDIPFLPDIPLQELFQTLNISSVAISAKKKVVLYGLSK